MFCMVRDRRFRRVDGEYAYQRSRSEPSDSDFTQCTISIRSADVLTFASTPWLLHRFATILGMILTYYDSITCPNTAYGPLSTNKIMKMHEYTHRTRSTV